MTQGLTRMIQPATAGEGPTRIRKEGRAEVSLTLLNLTDPSLKDAVVGRAELPWLFFIDREGRIAARVFGPVARSEVEETLRRLVPQRETPEEK